MKKLLLTLLMFFMIIGNVFATAGVTTVSPPTFYYIQGQPGRATITITWTGDDSTGAVTSGTVPISTNQLQGWYFYTVEVDPSAATPDASMTFTFKNSRGLDLAGGIVTGTSATATTIYDIGLGIPGFPVVTEDLTFAGTGNTDTTSGGTLILTFTSN